MKKLIIVLFLLIFLESVSAQSIELICPDEVHANSEFEVELKLVDFETAEYDVKIDITQDEERVSKILVNDEWKSTFYYVKNAITDDGTFELKVVECSGEADMIVRIRRSGASNSEVFTGYKIKIIEDSVDAVSPEKEPPILESIAPKENGQEQSYSQKHVEEETHEPIKIEFNNSKDIKSGSSTNFYKNLFAFSGILIISVFLGMVYIIKQGKYKNEFR